MDNNSATLDPNAATAMRFNQGKTRYALVPYTWTTALAEVMTRGAVKYAPDNWKKGMDPKFMVDSLERPLHAFRTGEVFDPESGNHHMAHVAWNALALMTYERDGMVPPEFYETRVPTSLTEPPLKDDGQWTEEEQAKLAERDEPEFQLSRIKRYGDPDFTNPEDTVLYWRKREEAEVCLKRLDIDLGATASNDYPGAFVVMNYEAEYKIRARYPKLCDALPKITKAQWRADQN